MIEIKHRGRGPWPNLPIAPSYLAYDWRRTTTTAVIIRGISVPECLSGTARIGD